MSTILKLSIDEYERMIASGAFVGIRRRIELIDGELREMSPAGPYHWDHIGFLTRWSISNVDASQATVQIQSGLLLGDSLPEPDVMWLEPKRYGGTRPTAANVLLIIEVSDSSLEFDLGEKMRLYAAAGIPEYWVVDIPGQRVHVHREPSDSAYQSVRIHRAGNDPSSLFDSKIVLSLQELFFPQ